LARLLVLKLGGSLITDKSRPYSLRAETIKAVSREIKRCLDEKLVDRMLIVHGVGSYGHPPVMEHKLYKGFIDPGQLLPLSKTQTKVAELRQILMTSLQEVGIPVILFHPSSMVVAEKGRITSMHLDPMMGFYKAGMVPVMGGDMVSDSATSFCVGSGDQIAAILAREFHATDLIFATDVKGVYDGDPKGRADARLIEELSLGDLEHLSARTVMTDASGAMRGKLANLEPLREEMRAGLRTAVISMMEPGRLRGLLEGEETEGTRIRP
jgi:isopentenyl phosphate kinase